MVQIIEDQRAEKTSVEFGEKQFAFPDRLGMQMADLLVSFARASAKLPYALRSTYRPETGTSDRD